MSAAALRDLGHQQVTDHADPRIILAIDAAIAELNATGMPWSVNDARDRFPVCHANLVGARVRDTAKRNPRPMRKVGMTRSSLRSTRAAFVAVWIGVSA